MITYKISNGPTYTLIEFELTDGIISPDALKSISPPDAILQNFAHKGVILSGRGPVWLYGFLVHYYHPTKWVATYDPRLDGAVVVETHTSEVQVGDVIRLKNDADGSN